MDTIKYNPGESYWLYLLTGYVVKNFVFLEGLSFELKKKNYHWPEELGPQVTQLCR